MKKCTSKGFTIIELMVTFVILAILALIAAPLTQVAMQRSKEQELRTALREIRGALDAYKLAADDGRISQSLEESGYPPSLNSLMTGVEDIKDPKRRKIYFMRHIPRDPMNDQSGNNPEISWGTRSYESPYDKPQGGKDVFDVYSLSKGIGLNGVPYGEW